MNPENSRGSDGWGDMEFRILYLHYWFRKTFFAIGVYDTKYLEFIELILKPGTWFIDVNVKYEIQMEMAKDAVLWYMGCPLGKEIIFFVM